MHKRGGVSPVLHPLFCACEKGLELHVASCTVAGALHFATATLWHNDAIVFIEPAQIMTTKLCPTCILKNYMYGIRQKKLYIP